MKIEYLFNDRLLEIMYGDINFAPYYMHSALRDKMTNVSSLICIQPLKKTGGIQRD